MKKVACFFTGGYTESNAMQIFLKKINDDIQLKQFCPNKTRKRKRPDAECDLISEFSGLTGKSLIQYLYHYLDKHKEEFADFDAIIIEDDLDGAFGDERTKGDSSTFVSIRNQAFEDHCNTIKTTVREKLQKDDTFPVIQFYASPEIETWFLADWGNSFGSIYGPKFLNILNANENQYFRSRFQAYINANVLKEYCEQLENYGYFNGEYLKLSEQIICSLDSFKVTIALQPGEISKQISERRELVYSKRLHGDIMLRQLSPESVKIKCSTYFSEAFTALKNL